MTNLEERLALLRVEHAKCKQAAAAHEAQALRIEGAISLVGEMLAEQAKAAKPITEAQQAPLTEQDSKQLRAVATNPPMTRIPSEKAEYVGRTCNHCGSPNCYEGKRCHAYAGHP